LKAMILAAGVGSRLKELTSDKPKCLVKAGTKTMLEHTVDRLKSAGVREIVINLHHFHEQVKAYCRQNNYFGVNISFSYEEELLGTGGGLQKVKSFFSDVDSFLLHNADVYTDLDLKKLINFHADNKGLLASLVVNGRTTSRPLLFAADGALAGWRSKNASMEELVGATDEGLQEKGFCGIHLISSRIFEFNNNSNKSYSIISSYLQAVREGQLIKAFPIDAHYWIDMGTPEKLEQLKNDISIS